MKFFDKSLLNLVMRLLISGISGAILFFTGVAKSDFEVAISTLMIVVILYLVDFDRRLHRTTTEETK